jgi:hypothetical protein
MHPEYAQKLLDGGYAFGNSYLSCHDDLLVIQAEDEYSYGRTSYSATKLKDGKLQVNEKGYVVFTRVEPVIDEHTRFRSPHP